MWSAVALVQDPRASLKASEQMKLPAARISRSARAFVWICLVTAAVAAGSATDDPPSDQPAEAGHPGARQEPVQLVIEGTVESVRPSGSSGLLMRLTRGPDRMTLLVERADGHSPARFSRIHVHGGNGTTEPPGNGWGDGRWFVPDWKAVHFMAGSLVPLATNVAQLARLGSSGRRTYCMTRLTGMILAASSGGGFIAFQDDTGTVLLRTDLQEHTLRAGQTVILTGNAVVDGGRVYLRNPPVVDNDGLHSTTERAGRIFLNAGRHPFHVSWFNLEGPHSLEVYYEGRGLPRQKIPDSALFHLETDSQTGLARWVPGLRYQRYEGSWLGVPDFDRLILAEKGTVANFDTQGLSRNTRVGIKFVGYMELPSDDVYTFSTISDDGSLLLMDQRPPLVERIGTSALPTPIQITAGQALGEDEPDQWSVVEGVVTFAGRRSGALILELASETGKLDVEVASGSDACRPLLLGSRIRAVGICRRTLTSDGRGVAGELVTPSLKQLELLEVPLERWGDYPVVSIAELTGRTDPGNREAILHLQGVVRSTHPDGTVALEDESGTVLVDGLQPPPPGTNVLVHVLGVWVRTATNVILQAASYRESTGSRSQTSKTLPVLGTVEQIKRLTRPDWLQGYPVNIRGVVTTVLHGGFFIQDPTGAIYARWEPPTTDELPHVGDYREVEGVTFAQFAPNIDVHRTVRLGAGSLPEPVRPTWDQLINGSLDTEYVELQGVVVALEPNGVTLLTRGGRISVGLENVQPQKLKQYEDALIRIRGCLIPVKDVVTQQMEPGRVQFFSAAVTVDETAPADPFSAPLKHASELLLFDSRAGAFQRVRVAGQILHERRGEYFLMDDHDGLRFLPKADVSLAVGDLVEVVGFADLDGPSPELREAIVRRTGQAGLPVPTKLPKDALVSRQYDSTLANVRARLIDVRAEHSELVFELQSETRNFVARLETAERSLEGVPPGSLLEVTGVYVGQGGDLAAGRDIDSFELLLNSAADIRVLAQPSWWTVRRALTVMGGMAVIVLAAFAWITLLRRQVEERSRELAAEVRRHGETERRRELETERARIARDLHDDLGATLTQIRFLSAVESRDAQVPEGTRERIGRISEKSRELVASLDEIVWAVNPTNDSLPSLVSYLSHFADEFLRPTPIRCRLDVDDDLPLTPFTSEVRHNVYLAVREALNNSCKHSHATEIWLRIRLRNGELGIIIEDNGLGCSPGSGAPSGNGLTNMRQRLEEIGGRFEMDTRPGGGTICRFWLPHPQTPGAVGQQTR